MADNINLDQIRTDPEFDLTHIYNETDYEYDDSPFQFYNHCSYHEVGQFKTHLNKLDSIGRSYFHLNCRGLSSNWEVFHELLCNLHSDSFDFDFIGVSEAYRCDQDKRLALSGYHDILSKTRDTGFRGGVALFVKQTINFHIRDDLSVFIPHVFESIFIEVESPKGRNSIIGVVYRPNTAPRADLNIFQSTMNDLMSIITGENKKSHIMGDMNIDLLKYSTHNDTFQYLDSVFSHGFIPVITLPTRVTPSSATLIDHIYSNDVSSTSSSGIILTDVADHFGTFQITKDHYSVKGNYTR